jgi:hypothetical protein
MSLENSVYGLLRYLGDVKQGVNWVSGNVPSWNETTGQFEPITPSGGGGGVNISNSDLVADGSYNYDLNNFTQTLSGGNLVVKGKDNAIGTEAFKVENLNGDSALKVYNGNSGDTITRIDTRSILRLSTEVLSLPNNKNFSIGTSGLPRVYFDIGAGNSYYFNRGALYTQNGIGAGVLPSARLESKGSGSTNGTKTFRLTNSLSNVSMEVLDDLTVILPNLPTSSAGLPTGAIWNNSGVLNVA